MPITIASGSDRIGLRYVEGAQKEREAQKVCEYSETLQPNSPKSQLRTVQDLQDSVRPYNAHMSQMPNAGHRGTSEQQTSPSSACKMLTSKVFLPPQSHDKARRDTTEET